MELTRTGSNTQRVSSESQRGFLSLRWLLLSPCGVTRLSTCPSSKPLPTGGPPPPPRTRIRRPCTCAQVPMLGEEGMSGLALSSIANGCLGDLSSTAVSKTGLKHPKDTLNTSETLQKHSCTPSQHHTHYWVNRTATALKHPKTPQATLLGEQHCNATSSATSKASIRAASRVRVSALSVRGGTEASGGST